METYPERFIKVPKLILSVCGTWPVHFRKFQLLYNVHGFFLAFFVSYSYVYFLVEFMINTAESFVELADAAYYTITHITYVIKLSTFVAKRGKLKHILDDIKRDVFNQEKPEQEHLLKRRLRVAHTYIGSYIACCFSVWVFYGMFPLVDSDTRRLPMNTWIPLDINSGNFNYCILYFYQMLALGVAISINLSYDLLCSLMMNIACTQVILLKNNLENSSNVCNNKISSVKPVLDSNEEDIQLFDKEEDEMIHQNIVKCIVHHEAIYRYLSDLEEVFGVGTFVQFISSGIIICMLGLEITVVPVSSVQFGSILSYFMAMVSQISLYCWNGNQIIVESRELSDSCYEMEWYRCSLRVRKSLIILMERCKIPLKMTARNFFQLTLSTLTAIFRSSYSYFAVLRQVYNK